MQKSSVPPPLLGDQVIVAALAGEEESPVDVDDVEEVDFEADGQGQLQGFSEQACAPRRLFSMHTPEGCKMLLVRPEGSSVSPGTRSADVSSTASFTWSLSTLRTTWHRQV